MSVPRKFWVGARVALFIAIAAPAKNRRGPGQGFGGGRRYWGNGDGDHGIVYTEPPNSVAVDVDTVRTAREIAGHSTDTPTWTNTPGFEKDVVTFARIIYRRGAWNNSSSPWGWITDFPDSDLNLSFRLQQVTSLRTSPEGRVLRLTDPALFDYPWIYIVEPGGLTLKEEEIPMLRKYLLNGGILWADDFWGSAQWGNFEHEIKRALPEQERTFVELEMNHEIFHTVFDIKVPKNKLQTPNIGQGIRSLVPGSYDYGVTWERHDGEECRDMHGRAMLD